MKKSKRYEIYCTTEDDWCLWDKEENPSGCIGYFKTKKAAKDALKKLEGPE